VEKLIPEYSPTDYASINDISPEHQEFAIRLSKILAESLMDFDVAFTHDWIFTSWKLPLAEALRLAADSTRHVHFLHWVHSRPYMYYDWWDIKRYGKNHKVVSLNHTDHILVADTFKGDAADVRVIPNIKDLRILKRFTQPAWDFIDEYPGLMNATFVQVYPAATDRLTDKGVNHLIHVFAELKTRGFSVSLVIANGWTGVLPKEDIVRYKRRAERLGLKPDEEFIFTSDFPGFESGVPHATLMDLMSCSSLFIFPSRGEADPLILPEAILMSAALPVLNRSLPVMMEIGAGSGLFFDFGSADRPYDPSSDYGWMADRIIGAFRDGIQSRTWYRRNLNMDRIYRKYYAPLFAELMENRKNATPNDSPQRSQRSQT
jgi:glycosyltransferase involved in cell wall biosynthesis